MCVCVCPCMRVCICVCMYAYVRVCACANKIERKQQQQNALLSKCVHLHKPLVTDTISTHLYGSTTGVKTVQSCGENLSYENGAI